AEDVLPLASDASESRGWLTIAWPILALIFGFAIGAALPAKAAGFGNGFEGAAVVVPPPPPADPCANNPSIKPQGFTRSQVTWEKMFYGQTFPRTPSFLTPVG